MRRETSRIAPRGAARWIPAAAVLLALAAPEPSGAEAPRPISPAERVAVELAARYLAGDVEAWWDRLAGEAPLARLPREEALAEIAVRCGPRQESTWTLVTPAAWYEGRTAVFTIEYPSGMGETLTLEFTADAEPRLVRLSAAVDPRQEALKFEDLFEKRATGPAPDAPQGTALVLAGALAASAAGLALRRTPARALAAVGVMLLLVAAACRREAATDAATGATGLVRLAVLSPLRATLTGGGKVQDLERMVAAIPAGPALDAARIWYADELLRQSRLEDAERLLAALPSPPPYPAAELVRGRLAFLRGDQEAALAALERARALGPDTDAIRLEMATVYAYLGEETKAEVAFLQLVEMGTRLAEYHYAVAGLRLGFEEEEAAEATFRTAWALKPLGRRRLLGDALTASVAARPAIFPLLALASVDEPVVRPSDLGAKALTWPAGAGLRLYGAELEAELAGARLLVPAGASLAPAATTVEPAGADRAQAEARALARFEAMERSPAATSLADPALRYQAVLAASALAERQRWDDLLRLTQGLAEGIGRAPSELVQLRAAALHAVERTQEARTLLVALARRDLEQGRRDPSLFLDLADVMAAEGDYELATRLLKRAAAAGLPEGRVEARLLQVAMEQRLMAASERHATSHFLIVYPRATGEKYAVEIGRVLEAERSRLRRWIPGVAEGERIEVLLFPVEEFLRSYSHGATVLGLFDGRIRVPFADLRSLHPTLVAILSHELAHALVAERVGSASVPTWFHEGLAQHVQMADQPTNELADLERSDRAIALPALEAILAGDGEPQFTEVAYAEAAWLVHYLEARFGVAALHRLLDAFAAGQSEEAALESITGETLGGLNAAFWEWGSRRAPAVWPTTLRRYDRELELAEVRGEPAAPARTLATTRPAGPDPAARRAAVESWHRGYTAKVRGMKSALGTVYRRLNGQDAGDLGAACRALEGELVPLLADRQLFSAPEAAINDSLRGAFVAFREAAAACSRGESAMSSAHIRAAERSLGTLASRLAAYGLDP